MRPKIDWQAALVLHRDYGWTFKRIAGRFRCRPTTVSAHVRALGYRRGRDTSEGVTPSEGAELGVSHRSPVDSIRCEGAVLSTEYRVPGTAPSQLPPLTGAR